MTTNPFVQLDFNPQEVHLPPQTGNYLGDLKEVMESSLVAARLSVIAEVRAELNKTQVVNSQSLLRQLDEAWVVYTPRFVANLGPLTAAAYYRAFRSAQAGEVPTAFIEDLAEKHVHRTLGYFRETSAESLIAGFNSFVNQQVPAKIAAERVMIAYGLTNRQMSGYVAASAKMEPKTLSPVASVKSKVYSYIEKSIRQRFHLFAEQEDHNISQEAQQVAWLWMKEHNQLTDHAMKMWITARDEKVCPSCGPLHGKKVRVENKFKTTLGEYWVPGLHPNCRCIVRLVDRPMGLVSKADFDPDEHPRAGDGRFARKPRQYGDPVASRDPEERRRAYSAVERMMATQPEPDNSPGVTYGERPELQVDLTPAPVEEEQPQEQVQLGRAGNEGPRTKLGRGRGQLQRNVSLDRVGTVNLGRGESPVTLGRGEQAVQLGRMQPINLDRVDQLISLKMRAPSFPPPVQPPIKTGEVLEIGYPLVAVVPRLVMAPEDSWMNMEHEVTFYNTSTPAGMERVKHQIGTELRRRVKDAETEITYNNEYRLRKVEDHVRLHAELSPDTWSEVLDVVSKSGWSDELRDRDREQYTFRVDWYDENNRPYSVEQLSAHDVAAHVNISEEDFVIPLARITRSHDGSQGDWTQISAPSRYGLEAWSFSGPFHVVDSPGHSGYEDVPNVREVDIVPDTEYTSLNEPKPGEPGWTERG